MRATANPMIDLPTYEMDPQRGFLPSSDPLDRLLPVFDPWEEVAHVLPKLMVTEKLRATLRELPVIPVDAGHSPAALRRAMLLLSYFGHAYVWGATPPADRLPRSIAMPWYQVSRLLGRPPVLSYASYALDNWRRIDPAGEIALGNIVLLQNFLGGIDEEWFILVHVEIEAEAGPALAAIPRAHQAVLEDDAQALTQSLEDMAGAVQRMFATLDRMPEHCDPYIYYRRVRPYIHGWKGNPALPDGVIYEGVEAYGGAGQQFRGETGAQSAIVPALDAALGVAHKDDPLRQHLLEMRQYMPPKHRAFLEAIEARPSIRAYVLAHKHLAALHDAYNECLRWTHRFRGKHLEYAATYIHKQAGRDPANPTTVGTGGTPFMPYLRKHRDETAAHVIRGSER
jgi:indoleamine 2,3-dioxygenase